MRIRRALLATLSDAAYDTVQVPRFLIQPSQKADHNLFADGMALAQSFHSDSAICFSIFLHHLPSLSTVQTPQALLQAMEARPAAPAKYLYTGHLAGEHVISAKRSFGPLAGPQQSERIFCRRRLIRSWQLRKLLA